MEARGRTPFEQAVAFVYTSRYGLGGAAFHQGDVPAGPADTVFLGVFDKAEVQAVGGFDETMFRAQDWELNYRLRQSGRVVWFSPELRVTYRPRSTLKALIKQMYDTGTWRREVVRRHPDTASVRYLAPPAAVVAIGVGTLGALLGRVTGSRFLQLGCSGPGRLRGLRRVRDGHGTGDPPAGGSSLAARRAGRHPPGLGERVPGRPPLTGSSEAGGRCAGRGWCAAVAAWCFELSVSRRLLRCCWVAGRWNFPSVDGKLPFRRGGRREPPSTDGIFRAVDRAGEALRRVSDNTRASATNNDGHRSTPSPNGRHLRHPQPSRRPDAERHDDPGAEGVEHSQTVHQEGGSLVGSGRQRPGRSPVPTHLPRHLRRRGRRDHRRSPGPSCAAGRPARLLCQPPHGRAAVGWVVATDLRDPPQLADQVDAVRTARCRGARGRPGTHASTAARSDRQPTGAGVPGAGVDTPEPGRSGGRGRLVGDRSRVVSGGSGRRSRRVDRPMVPARAPRGTPGPYRSELAHGVSGADAHRAGRAARTDHQPHPPLSQR